MIYKEDAEMMAQRIRDKLAAVPDYDALLAELRGGGITGIKGDSCHCPVANWLNTDPEMDGPGLGVAVAGCGIFLYYDNREIDEEDCIIIDTPNHFRSFIEEFDGGRLLEFELR